MARGVVVWNGDADGMLALMTAIEHNCNGGPPASCGAHKAILDQRFLDGVLWARWAREQLIAEEQMLIRHDHAAKRRSAGPTVSGH